MRDASMRLLVGAVALAAALLVGVGNAGPGGGAALEGAVVVVRSRVVNASEKDSSWLELQRLDGTGRVALTKPIRPGERRSDTDPVISPDGAQVAFTRVTRSGRGLFVVASDGTRLRRAFAEGIDWNAVWARAGDKLAVTSYGRNMSTTIYRVGLDGSGTHRLRSVRGDRGQIGAIDWAPDGARLLYLELFGEVRPGAYEGPEFVRTITEARRETLLVRTRDYLGGAAWSPTGERIAFANGCLDACNLFVVRSTGGRARALTTFREPSLPDNAFDQLPFAWTGRDDEIVVARERTVLTVDARTGAARRVARLPHPRPGGDGLTVHILSVSQDGASALLEVATDSGEGAFVVRYHSVDLDTGRLRRVDLPTGWGDVRLD